MPSINIEFSKPTIAFGWNFENGKENDSYYIRRQIGSIALAMAQLANGSYEGLIMRPYNKKGEMDVCDIAAGYYIMKQVGLEITDYYGSKFNYKNPENGIIAYNPKIRETVDKIMFNEKPGL
jgi:fructose-1,6-bisphosphatase/inositol monophosphatase family enzyme